MSLTTLISILKTSVRKTTVRKLQKAGVSNDKIIAITEHKNEQCCSITDTYFEDQSRNVQMQHADPAEGYSNHPAPQFNCSSYNVQFGNMTFSGT